MKFTATTHNEEETLQLGASIGSLCTGGEIIALSGELGAGKTCLAKGIARGLGVDEVITSSSFVLASTYKGRLTFHHLDFYRLYDIEDFDTIGFDDYPGDASVVVVEWAERFLELIPEPYIYVKISIVNESTREFHYNLVGADTNLECLLKSVKDRE